MLNHLNRQISAVWGITAIVIISAVFLGLIQLYLSETSEILSKEVMITGPVSYNCKAVYNNIEKDFEEANFCEKDEDCEIMEIGGIFFQFGCYKFVNVETNKQKFYDRMVEYYQYCESPIDNCLPTPEVICLDNKCVAKSDLEK